MKSEQLSVRTTFEAAHRQPLHDGHCKYIHGHSWTAEVNIVTWEFPRNHMDMSIDFGTIKGIIRSLDHKMLITQEDVDKDLYNAFPPEGFVVIPGKSASAENVAEYLMNKVVVLMYGTYGRNLDFTIDIKIVETPKNEFNMSFSHQAEEIDNEHNATSTDC